jgi:type VI secretion system protein ImpA
MAGLDLQSLIGPVSEDDPCGPDLDLGGDADYMNFVAGAEGRLPSSYFDGKDESGASGRPFQFSKTDVESVFTGAAPLLAKTRDLRLLVLLSKFSLLGRQFEDFRTLIQAVANLLTRRWDEVHPRAESDEFQARMVALESIDVQPTVIMPLQFLPLIEHRRFGSVSFRSYLIATGAASPRENEEVIDQATIDKLIREVELADLVTKRGEFLDLQSALNEICRTWSEKDSSGGLVSLDKTIELVGKIVTFLDGAATLRDPAAALAAANVDHSAGGEVEGEAEGTPADGADANTWRVTNQGEAGAALSAVEAYFNLNEPSSPTLPLVRQARQLLGRSFIDVMRTLVPTHFEQATIEIGRTDSFRLPVERLATLTGEGEGTTTLAAPASDHATTIEARTRNQALSLLDQVAAYFRAAEPSSPIPFIIERARDLAQRDFLSVLKSLLPPDSLKTDSGNTT